MKKSIENKIKENREAFDTDQPDKKVWENIHAVLHPAKKKKILPWTSVAAGFVLLASAAWYFYSATQKQTEENKTALITTADSSSVTVSNQQALRGHDDMSRFADKSKSYIDFRGVQSQLGRDKGLADITAEKNIVTTFSSSGTYTPVIITDANACTENQELDLGYRSNRNLLLKSKTSAANYSWSFGDEDWIEEYDPGYYYEQYDEFEENKFVKTLTQAQSTFGIDVDGAGYSNMRRFINQGFLPPKHAVKLEEMINYFKYDLPEPSGEHPFSIITEFGECPWNKNNHLLQVFIKGKSIAMEKLPASNLVFLLDVSGSMDSPDKLPLLKKGLTMLVNEMRVQDRISIVVYAGAAGLVLSPTSGNNKQAILEALNNLEAGGSTAGGEGINLAYTIAEKSFIKNGNNRIILATDGDFNVGVTDDEELIKIIEEKRKSGVFLSVLGFGEGNLQSSKMEKLADNGNGNYSYIDNVLEAKKVLVTEMGGTLYTIAKDVKLQLEFNPHAVESYRLLGYENRMLATEDFDNDAKDAGDLGSGHTIVALYEIVPVRKKDVSAVNDLKYQVKYLTADKKLMEELVTIKFRYKKPAETQSRLLSVVVQNKVSGMPSANFRFASAVAEFGLLIRESEFRGNANFDNLIKRAKTAKGKDENGYRTEFLQLCEAGQLIFEDYKNSKKTIKPQ